MLDCHVLSLPARRGLRLQACLESVHRAAKEAPFGIEIHLIHCEPDGHIGNARAIGYHRGTQPYVTCVDDDDWIEPHAFACLYDAMKSNVPAIYTREMTWQNGKPAGFDGRQHLRVFRRDVVESFNFSAWPALESTALIAHADTFGPGVNLLDRVYNYVIDPESSARQIAKRTHMYRQAEPLGLIHD
jgi:hypothetical protein